MRCENHCTCKRKADPALDELLAAAEETARALRIIGERQLEPGLIPIAAYLESAIAKYRESRNA